MGNLIEGSFLIFCAGGLLLLLGVFMLGQSVIRIATWRRCQGKIVGYKTEMSDDQKFYLPRVSFTDASGEVITFNNPQGRGVKGRKKNDSVTVLYNPRDPKDAQIKSWSNLWLSPFFFLGLSAPFIIKGLQEMGYL